MSDDRLPIVVLVPDSAGVIDMYEQSAALHLAVVDRAVVSSLGSDWDEPGVYVLLDRPGDDGRWGCYVGKAPAGIKSRLTIHVRGKDHWARALLIKRDTTHGFNSAHTAWLEGRLHDMLEAAVHADLHNKQRPGDDTLAPYDRLMLEAAVDPISRALRLIGYDPTSETSTPSMSRGPRARFEETVLDLINSGLLEPPVRVVSTLGTFPGDGTILEDGRIRTEHGNYDSPSTAGTSITGRPVNGWDFWALETPTGRVRLSTLRTRLRERRSQAQGPHTVSE